ncbi:hypothetical protein KUTeg_007366 [Tegillarca granosa]|uniref:Beta-1,4-N-acetylgalactosaminyltransferase bre-4 n=1 Tax=Tegillarca granosa TaxID=220873 RepID=A0ABQ9FD44_TEGGR|nr:hypothetical protein KUTeg_007366 [Tegillarca granosa]
MSWSQIEYNHRNLQAGGRHKPSNCTARHRVAIIIPFRDRDMHLKLFLNNIHPFLQRQQLDYGIYVIDQLYDYQCFIFHDVDLIPEYDLNMYTCPENPRHMSVAIDKYKYRLPYAHIFGGVVAITREQFQVVNGFSNQFFGWGGEDDDMFNRIKLSNMSISRYTSEVARYKSLSHAKEKPNPARFKLIRKGMKGSFKHEGLNTIKYKRLKLDLRNRASSDRAEQMFDTNIMY